MVKIIEKIFELMLITKKHNLEDDLITYIGYFKIERNKVIDTRNGNSYEFNSLDEIYGIINILEKEYFQGKNINFTLEKIDILCDALAKMDKNQSKKLNISL